MTDGQRDETQNETHKAATPESADAPANGARRPGSEEPLPGQRPWRDRGSTRHGSRHTGSADTGQAKLSGWALTAIAWALFILFLTYFNVTSNTLPYGAGPDYAAHDDISRFIYENQRLPVLPADEGALKFTPYGGTRALRPPLTYMVSGTLARVLDTGKPRLEILFRKASALFMALTVFVVFWTCLVYFSSVPLALFGATAVGLMPQFSFIASYNNDDAGAIFSASLMLLAMVLVLRRGAGWLTLAFMGFAAGMIILTKQSAWLLAPTVLLFSVFFILRHLPKVIGPMIIGLIVAALSGGWWIAKNVRDYGPDDPFLQKAVKITAEKHSRFPPDKKFGYAANGVGALDLLRNHRDFLVGTGISTIGNLDWLRLRVGQHVYWFYAALAALGALYFLARLLSLVLPGELRRPDDLVFETLLVAAIVFQFAMYMWANLYNDIQVQGKYLLPMISAVAILAIAGLRMLGSIGSVAYERFGIPTISITPQSIGAGVTVSLIVAVLLLHRDSLMNYVLPFYQPDFYREPLRQISLKPFVPVNLDPGKFLASNEIDGARLNPRNKLDFVSTGADPWFVPTTHKCAGARDNSLVRVTLRTPAKGRFTVYWDDGDGFNPGQRSSVRYGPGSQQLHIWIAPRECRKLRFDPGNAPGHFQIDEIAVAQVDIGPARGH